YRLAGVLMSDNAPIWMSEARRGAIAPLRSRLDVDVVVVGGGITGLTTALLAASDGRRVALLEADRIGSGTTGATSAQVTAVPDLGYEGVLQRCGSDAGSIYVARCSSAIEFMASLVDAERIACGWDRVPAYWFSVDDAGRDRLQREAQAA